MNRLDLTADPVDLCAALVDVPSVSGDEVALADAVEAALRAQAPHLEVLRSGDAVLARTNLGRPSRVVLAGHLDTVPIADNVPSRRDGDLLYGCGTSDMKSGDAVFLHLAATIAEPRHDVTLVLYELEEVEAVRNGLGRLEREHRDWLAADLALLGEPTNSGVEAGCQGTLRVEITTHGRRAHSARSWLGRNAVHGAGAVLDRLNAYTARDVDIDGCVYREGLQAVKIAGGVAGNVVPDECVVTVNFRFAPDRDAAAAEKHVREVFDGFAVVLTDLSPGALPGLTAPAAREFIAATGATPSAKYGWTDVSRFAALGIPAVNYGPGDPNLAHTREEHVDTRQITEATAVLRRFLG
ncbi:succinyl-diaminopimelate desuccinylase [Pseudonocardia sp. 73-21]|uniref:succinyl-diaminopimelate desuccinylase n=1 Tax=Pseudonocardia sp. 73-21 TaxID=1895809 RepID=UPI000961B6DA|nr:succinyl-diaminopimelate desuccinylase [Pseudonocardia sp. 73-21]OJY43600.1 MAG: succinyl-diaminopimelate desuccinylase [Pseudonocardia sp. 73-21]